MSKAIIPREITAWFNRLDLTYAVKNLTRDLANGFVVAEIVSRYYPKEIDMYQFYNGLKIEKRFDNWKRVAKVLEKHGRRCPDAQFEPVIYLKKDAALDFIKE